MSDKMEVASSRLSRRQFIRTAVVASGGVAVAVTLSESASAATKKFTQQQAHYQAVPKNGQRCQSCGLYQPPTSCQVVEGPVSPAGWCILYQQKG
jgi:secreted PhoX family phosphatase